MAQQLDEERDYYDIQQPQVHYNVRRCDCLKLLLFIALLFVASYIHPITKLDVVNSQLDEVIALLNSSRHVNTDDASDIKALREKMAEFFNVTSRREDIATEEIKALLQKDEELSNAIAQLLSMQGTIKAQLDKIMARFNTEVSRHKTEVPLDDDVRTQLRQCSSELQKRNSEYANLTSSMELHVVKLLHDLTSGKHTVEELTAKVEGMKFIPYLEAGKFNISDLCGYKLFASCTHDVEKDEWIVIQKRINGIVDFSRDWTEYERGFGDLNGEFWYGLHNIHILTTTNEVELRIELGKEATPAITWTYKTFRVSGPDDGYRLTIREGSGIGDSYDSMVTASGEKFYTHDFDTRNNCAKRNGAGWWYDQGNQDHCLTMSNLNGRYEYQTKKGKFWEYSILSWHTASSDGPVHYPRVTMKIRPKRSDSCDGSNCAEKSRGWW